MNNKKSTKNFVISLAMAALLLLPLTMTAQYDEDKYGIQPWFGSSMLGRENASGTRDEGSTITNYGIGETSTPLGSGIGILLLAGAGYVALKKKEDKQ